MRAARKIIVFSSLFLLILAGLLAAAVYLYKNPEIVAARAGQYFCDAFGLDVRAESLDWSLRPLRIDAGAVSISSPSKPGAFQVEIQEIGCRMHLDGRFGRRVLIVDSIRAEGVSVEIQDMDFGDPGERSEGNGVLEGFLERFAGFLFFKDILITEISLQDGDVDARFKDFDLNMSRLSAHRDPDGRVKIEGDADIHMRDIDGALSAPDIRLTLQPGISFPSIKVAAGLEINGAELTIGNEKIPEIYGRFVLDADFAEQSIEASNAGITAGSFLKFDGSLEGRLEPRPTFELQAERCVIQLSDLPTFISSVLPQVKANGSLHLSGRAGGILVDEKWNLEGDAEALVEDTAFSWETVRGDFAGVISGRADFSIDSKGFAGVSSAGLVLSRGTFSNDAAVFDFGNTEMRFSGRHPKYAVERFSARLPRAVSTKPGKGFNFENIHVTGSGSGVDLDSRSVDFPEVSISLSPLGNFSARGRISPEMSFISVAGEDLGLIPLAVQHGLVPVDWEVSGRNRIQLEASMNSKGAIALNSEIKLEGFSFEDPNGRFIGEKLSAGLDFEGTADMDSGSISGELSVGAADGEVLFDLFYMDLMRNPFRAGGAVEFFISERRASVSRYELGFENLFDLLVEGTAATGPVPSGRLSVNLARTSLPPLYDLVVRGPFGRQSPLLNGLQPEGMISARLELAGTPVEFSVKGGIELRSGRVFSPEKEIYGGEISIDLPVWIEAGSREKRVNAGVGHLPGRFSVADLRVPLLPAQRFDFNLEAAPNRILIPVPPVVHFSGGRIEPGGISFGDFLREGVRAETSVRVLSKDLSPILSRIWPGEKGGKLEGVLDPVIFKKDHIVTGGRVEGEIFGGVISITGLEAERIFSSAPVVKLSADFSGIDLGKLTGDTPFGRIEGIMNGYIRDLEIAGIQPQRFDMLLETAERGRGGEKISLRAVENISRIGAGESPFVGFAGVLTSFFETLSYRKIGIKATLSNDYFTVNGTIKEDETEYIMKRGGISGVNIVNRNPDNRIRFKDMVKRIKRVLEEDQ